jgi:glucokinase
MLDNNGKTDTDKTQLVKDKILGIQQDAVAENRSGYVVGVDVGGTNLRMALADMTGAPLIKWSTSTVGLRGPDAVIGHIVDGVRELLTKAAAAPEALKSVAVGVPGVTNTKDGVVIATSYLMGWRNVPLKALLEDELHVPCAVDNDVNLAAIGESWAGAAKGSQDFVFLAIGTGIGAGIFLNGCLYRGSCWAAGEIGYMLLPGTVGGPGKSHEPGPLESMIGGEGIREQWRRIWNSDKTTLPKELTATEIFDHALRGEPLAQTILQESATMLAHAIYNISLVLNCSLFVLGGSVGPHPALRDAVEVIVDQWNIRGRPRLAASALGQEAQLLGAIRTALDTTKAKASSGVVVTRN